MEYEDERVITDSAQRWSSGNYAEPPQGQCHRCQDQSGHGEAFIAFRDDPTLRVAIITGAGGRFFSAGWDLKAAAEGEAPDADFGPGGFAGLTELFNPDKPVIAAVNGYAFGGGFELALAADMIVCADNACFALPEAGWGSSRTAAACCVCPSAFRRRSPTR